MIVKQCPANHNNASRSIGILSIYLNIMFGKGKANNVNMNSNEDDMSSTNTHGGNITTVPAVSAVGGPPPSRSHKKTKHGKHNKNTSGSISDTSDNSNNKAKYQKVTNDGEGLQRATTSAGKDQALSSIINRNKKPFKLPMPVESFNLSQSSPSPTITVGNKNEQLSGTFPAESNTPTKSTSEEAFYSSYSKAGSSSRSTGVNRQGQVPLSNLDATPTVESTDESSVHEHSRRNPQINENQQYPRILSSVAESSETAHNRAIVINNDLTPTKYDVEYKKKGDLIQLLNSSTTASSSVFSKPLSAAKLIPVGDLFTKEDDRGRSSSFKYSQEQDSDRNTTQAIGSPTEDLHTGSNSDVSALEENSLASKQYSDIVHFAGNTQ